jgi:hypothetical protein
MTQNFANQYVRMGNEGMLNNAAAGPGMVSDSLTSLFTTRGSIDLNENRLPNANDVNVRPDDPLIANDAFVVSGAGTVPTGVGGQATLNVGDLLVIVNNLGATTATNWIGVQNTALSIPTAANSSFHSGQQNMPPRVISKKLPFFP